MIYWRVDVSGVWLKQMHFFKKKIKFYKNSNNNNEMNFNWFPLNPTTNQQQQTYNVHSRCRCSTKRVVVDRRDLFVEIGSRVCRAHQTASCGTRRRRCQLHTKNGLNWTKFTTTTAKQQVSMRTKKHSTLTCESGGANEVSVELDSVPSLSSDGACCCCCARRAASCRASTSAVASSTSLSMTATAGAFSYLPLSGTWLLGMCAGSCVGAKNGEISNFLTEFWKKREKWKYETNFIVW